MTIRQFAFPFVAGVVVGVLVSRNWDTITETVGPVARRISRRSGRLAGLVREKAWEGRERVEDLLAEWHAANPQRAEPGTPG